MIRLKITAEITAEDPPTALHIFDRLATHSCSQWYMRKPGTTHVDCDFGREDGNGTIRIEEEPAK